LSAKAERLAALKSTAAIVTPRVLRMINLVLSLRTDNSIKRKFVSSRPAALEKNMRVELASPCARTILNAGGWRL
jgi:hypothetical protein